MTICPTSRILGTVGEPINPEAWNWYNDVVGKGKCPIVDTWWQTETGGHLLTPLPGAHATKPGSAMKPFFGIQPVVLEPPGRRSSRHLSLRGRALYPERQLAWPDAHGLGRP